MTLRFKALVTHLAIALCGELGFAAFQNLYLRVRGNNSGSGTTTANNIEAGVEVVADLLTYCYEKKYNELPPLKLIIEQLVALYGDDNQMALRSEFDLLLDSDLVKGRLLSQHGLICKWLVGGIEHPWSELPFLGFTFHEYKSYIIPKWTIERLMHPILYTPNRKTIGQYLQQCYALMIMSFAHYEIFLKIRAMYIMLLQFFNTSGSPDVKVMIRLGVPTISEIESFYLGFESSVSYSMVTGGGGPFLNKMESCNNIKSVDTSNDVTANLTIETKSLYDNYHRYCDYCQQYGLYCIYHTPFTIGKYNNTPSNNLLLDIEDLISNSRVSSGFKEGGFNKYGNGQSMPNSVTVYVPSYRTCPTGEWECYSTISYDNQPPVACIGNGVTQIDSFNDWLAKVEDEFDPWIPVSRLQGFLKLIQSVPPPPKEHPLAYLWADDMTAHIFEMLVEGFNKYGNGQGSLTKKQYLAKHKVAF